jgi:hypothetical protein
MQHVDDFHETAGVYADTVHDPELLGLARKIAQTIGHFSFTSDVVRGRMRLRENLGLTVFACGKGGHLVCRKASSDYPNHTIVVNLAP